MSLDYKAELDKIAAVIYPHKKDRYTYNVDFICDEIRLRDAEIEHLRKDKGRLEFLFENNAGVAKAADGTYYLVFDVATNEPDFADNGSDPRILIDTAVRILSIDAAREAKP